MGKVVFHFALVQFACYCIYVFCFATCKRYHININALIEWTSTKSNLFFSFLLSCTFSLKLLLLAYLCLTVKSRQKLERQKHSRLYLKPKNQIFSPPNRQLQSSSPSYKLSAYRTMPVPIGSDWRMQSVQTLMPPSIVNVTNSSFPIYFPRQFGWKKSARKVPIIFLRVAVVVELCCLVN